MSSVTGFVRVEPRARTSDLAEGLAARVHDPLWLLGRQWQFGEFLGEDAGTPSTVRLRAERSVLTRYYLDPSQLEAEDAIAYDGATAPLECVVEAEPIHTRSSWTPRLKAEAGLEFLRRLGAAGFGSAKADYLAAYPLHALTGDDRATADATTVGYSDIVAGRVPNGETLYADLANAVAAGALPDVPAVDPGVLSLAVDWVTWCSNLFVEPGNRPLPWRADRLEYSFAVSAPTSDGELLLEATAFGGGALDWYAFDQRNGQDLQPALGDAASVELVRTVVATPVRFNGMPHSRWWQLEDANIDFGHVDASSSDLAKLLVLEFALIYGNDFYSVPIDLPIGSICRTHSLVITDTFGLRTRILPSAYSTAGGSTGWKMFTLSERDPAPTRTSDSPNVFLLPPTLGQHLTGATIEEVLLLRDEMANLVWGVERTVESGIGGARDRSEEFRRRAGGDAPEVSQQPALLYRLATTIPDYWFPLVPIDTPGGVRLKRGTMASLSGPMSEPKGELLTLGATLLYEEEVPREGARLTRKWRSARWIDGSTHVWVSRDKTIGRGEGSSGLRFDVLRAV